MDNVFFVADIDVNFDLDIIWSRDSEGGGLSWNAAADNVAVDGHIVNIGEVINIIFLYP